LSLEDCVAGRTSAFTRISIFLVHVFEEELRQRVGIVYQQLCISLIAGNEGYTSEGMAMLGLHGV
jgi:hypothetical protein